MQFRLQLTVITDDGPEQLEEVVCLERGEASPATLGLSVAEGKDILRRLQELVLAHQVQAHLQEQRACPHCGRARTTKESGTKPYRTPFGKVELPNPRWHHCPCQRQSTKTFRPMAALLTEPTSPELLYLENKWASLVSYGVTTNLLHDVLPVDDRLSAQSVRNHLHRVAEREERALGEEQEMFVALSPLQREQLPVPDGPLTVGLDGGYVRGRSPTRRCEFHESEDAARPSGWFEIITGKSMLAFRRDDPGPAGSSKKCFGLVQSYDTKPKRRLYEMLRSQGLQENQQVTFLSDGGDTVRELQWYLSPEAEHLLDWFHLTMRLTVLGQCARGLEKLETVQAPPRGDDQDEEDEEGVRTAAELARTVESAKHYLWHGNVTRALDRVDDLRDGLLALQEVGGPPLRDGAGRMRKHVEELETYVRNNRSLIVNYGERYRNGETISTAFVESTVNQVISRRMVKKQQMQWTPRGAHLLLQVRTRVLNEDLEETFRRRYPGFRPPADEALRSAA